MASNTATSEVLLQVLNRHLENKPHEQAEITINGTKHAIVSSELDFVVRDNASSLLAARVILTVREISRPDPSRAGRDGHPAVELAAHITTSTSPGLSSSSSSPSSSVIIDEVPQSQGGSPPAAAAAPPPPHRASTIPTHPLAGGGGGSTRRRPLAETYGEYISAFMTADEAAAAALLPRFLHQPVAHNARALTVPQYHGLGRAARDAIPDICCEVAGLAADEARQVVAARLEFSGTLVRPFPAGAPRPRPLPEGGRAVRIGEIVFYWFDGGRIREVVSLVDLAGLGARST